MQAIWLACLVLASLLSAAENNYFPPPESQGGWRKNTDSSFITSMGIVPDKLEEFGQYNLAVPNTTWWPYAKYKGTLVIKNGWLIGEWYNSPEAETFKTYISSNGKSFAMACFGILMQDSQQGDIDMEITHESKVYDSRWLSEGFPLSDPMKNLITFEQIFQHISGLCPERTNGGEMIEQGRDEWSDYVDWLVGRDEHWPQTKKLYFTPGKLEEYRNKQTDGNHTYAYSSVAFGHLGLVFQNIYQIPAHQFLWNRLLGPLGFTGIDYYAPPNKKVKWFSAGGLQMTPRDYARFAYFLLRDGRWEKDQIVNATWIQRFRMSHQYPNIRSNVDGYFGEHYPKDMFRIFGSGLNWAFIIPSLDLIALRTGRSSNDHREKVEKQFLDKLFAAVAEQRLGQDKKEKSATTPFQAKSLPELAGRSDPSVGLKSTGQKQEASWEMQRAADLDPRFLEYQYSAARALQSEGRYNEAIPYLERIIKIHPAYNIAEFWLGFALQKSGQSEKAVDMYNRFLWRKPDHVQGHFNLGYELMVMKKYTGAVEHFNRVLELSPSYKETHLHLSKCYRMLGNEEMADRHMQEYRGQ